MRKKYESHVKHAWEFSNHIVYGLQAELDEDSEFELTLLLFDKCCKPYYYFMKELEKQKNEMNGNKKSGEPASQKQMIFAYKLGIRNPEKYTKQELSDLISEATKKKEKYGRWR